MQKPSEYFKKLDLAHLDANTSQFIREKVLTLPNIDILEGTKEFETLKAIIEESFPRAVGIEPIVVKAIVEPILEVVPEVIIEKVIAPVIDTKQIEIDSITTQVSEMSDLIELMNEVVSENKDDLDSRDVLELYNETLVDLKDKLSKLSVVILDAIEEVKENIQEVKEIIKTDTLDTKGILTYPKKYKTEDGEEVSGYESNWNFGLNKHLGETVVYYVSNEEDKSKYSVLTGILHKGEIIYSTDKTSNKEFENYSENEKEALSLAYELANDKEAVDKYSIGGFIAGAVLGVAGTLGVQKVASNNSIPVKKEKAKEEKEKWNDVVKSYVDKEGFDYALDGYSDFKEIAAPKGFYSLRTEYLKHKRGLGKYINNVLPESKKEGVLSYIDNEGFNNTFTGGYDYKGIKDSKLNKLINFYLKSVKELSDYIGLDKYEKGGSVKPKKIGSIKSFNPESLIGYGFFGTTEYSTIVGVKEHSEDNIRLIRESSSGLGRDSSFTKKELYDLYSGKQVKGYEAFELKKEDAKEENTIEDKGVYLRGEIDGNPYQVIADNYRLNLVRVKNFSNGDVKEMAINKWIPYTFELGTPATFIDNGREVSGEIVLRDGRKAISLYKDSNYSGGSERIRFLDEIDLSTLKSFMSNKEKFEKGGEVGDNKFTYMMLGRLQSDNDYFLGHGNRGERALWAGNVDGQIEEMKRLWNSLPENGKPEWLSMEDILEYERKMKGEYSNDSDKDENVAKIKFNDHWKTIQLFIDGSLYGEFDTYQDAVTDAKNNNSKVIIEDDVTMLDISTSNPLSNQLSKITGDGWNSIDYENLAGGNEVTTMRPFKHISSGKIFEVVKK